MKKHLRNITDGLYWDKVTPDEDSPEATEEDFKNARPFKEVFPELYAEWERKRGRPKSAIKKREIKLRLDPEIVERFKAQGPGWMTQMNNALKRASARLPLNP